MTTKVTNSSIAPAVKTEATATTSAAAVEAGTKPLDRASIGRHFADFGYPAPHRFALLFPRLTASAQAALTKSIRLNKGIRDPITMFNGQIADGISRCLSTIELGLRWGQLHTTKFEGDEAVLLQFVIDKNLSRGHLNPSQLAMVAARMANMRQGARTDLAQICAMSQQEAADRVNVSRRLVQDAVKVIKEGVPALQAAVDSGILTVTAAVTVLNLAPNKQRAMVDLSLTKRRPDKAFAKAVRAEENESRHGEIIAKARRHGLSGKRYLIGVADIPWPGRISRGGKSPYPRLSIEEVCAFRLDDGRLVRDAMADDSILLFWCIDSVIVTGVVLRILEAWGGFEFKYLMPWPTIEIGLGQHARLQHQVALLCVRGNFPTPLEALRPSTLIVGPPLIGGNGFSLRHRATADIPRSHRASRK
jgi:hypothetical protein